MIRSKKAIFQRLQKAHVHLLSSQKRRHFRFWEQKSHISKASSTFFDSQKWRHFYFWAQKIQKRRHFHFWEQKAIFQRLQHSRVHLLTGQKRRHFHFWEQQSHISKATKSSCTPAHRPNFFDSAAGVKKNFRKKKFFFQKVKKIIDANLWTYENMKKNKVFYCIFGRVSTKKSKVFSWTGQNICKLIFF